MKISNSSAKVYLHPNSPYFQAVFPVWDRKKEKWMTMMRSTRTKDKAKAQMMARRLEKFAAVAAGVTGDTRISREYIIEVINDILSICDQAVFQETRQWDEYSQEWLALQTPRISPRSLESYTSHVRLFTRWLGQNKDATLKGMNGKILQSWYDEMIDEGRKPATVNNTLKALQAIFDRARAEGFCKRNPAELVLRQYGEKNVRETFTQDDIAKIFAYLRNPGFEEWHTVCLLGLWTGQRLQDCAQAKAEEFSGKGGHRIWRCKQRKTGALVEIPLIEPLASHIAAQTVTSGYLCPSLAVLPTGGPGGLSMAFSDILDAAGVQRERTEKKNGSKGQSWTNKTFHSFRHTTNSLLANAGVSQEIRQHILGHASSRVNDGYTHLKTKTVADALNKAKDEANN